MRGAQRIPKNRTDDDGRSEIVLLVSVKAALSDMSTPNIKCILNKVTDQIIPIGY